MGDEAGTLGLVDLQTVLALVDAHKAAEDERARGLTANEDCGQFDPPVRRATEALEALGIEALPALDQIAAWPNDKRAPTAAYYAGEIRRKAEVAAATAALHGADAASWPLVFAEHFFRQTQSAARAALLGALKRCPDDVRAARTMTLLVQGDEGAELVARLADERAFEWDAVRRGVDALCAAGTESARACVLALARASDPAGVHAALALANSALPAARALFDEVRRALSVAQRLRALAFARTERREGLDAVRVATRWADDDAARVRRAAVGALVGTEVRGLFDVALAAVCEDQDPEDRATAVYTLGRCARAEARESEALSLLKTLRDPAPVVRAALSQAIQELSHAVHPQG